MQRRLRSLKDHRHTYIMFKSAAVRTCMMRSNTLVLSAWKALHCRHALNTTSAARGLPLWKPMGLARAVSSFSSSCLRRSWMSCCCLA
jgi:hypothetical protein